MNIGRVLSLLFQAVLEGKSRDIAFVFVLLLLITIGYI